MPITLFDAASDVPSDVPSVTIPLGANTAAGDLRIIRAERSRGNGGLSISSGWTQLYASEAQSAGGPYSRWVGIWYRVVQAGDSAPTLTPSTSIANIGWTAVTVRGALSGQTLSQSTTGSSGSSTSVTAPSVATGAGVLLCWFDVTRTDGTANTGSWGTPSGMTSRTASLSPNANGYNVLLASEDRTSGASGTRTATAASAGSWSASSLFIAAAPDGPTTKTAADSGVRTETVATTAQTTVTEVRQGTDSAATGSSFTATDSVQFVEGVAAGQLTDGPDTGTGTDSVTGLAGTLAAADPRHGADTLATSGSFTALDSGTTSDESTTITLPVTETGTRTEAVSSRGSFTAADPRTGADAATVETLYGDLVISIWAVDPDTGQLTALPDFTKLTMSPERNGSGSISLEYPRDGLNFHVLRDTITADRDLEVEIWNFGNNRGALRGYLQESSGDDIAEDQTAWTFAGGFLELRMAEAIVWPQPIVGEITLGENVDVPYGSVTQAQWDRLLSLGYTGTAGDNEEKITGVPQKVLDAVKANATSIPVLADPKRELKFETVTVGELVNFILTQARSRGGLLDIATSFTNAADSNGVTWPTSVTTKYSPGASYESILNSLASQGRVEWSLTWDGTRRVLNLYVPSGRGVDRTIGLRPVVLRAGRNLAEAPRKWSVRSTATAMLGIGAEGFYADASNLDAETRRGRRIEDSTSSQNLATADAVLAYAQRRLSTKKDGTLEVTHGLAMLPGEPRPLIAFDIGDWVYSQTATSLDRYRVVQWTLTVDAGQQASATVTLNDAFLDAVSRQQKELDALTSGETVVGTSEESNKTDTGVPSAPEGLVVGSGAFAEGQDAYAVVNAGWAAVTTNTDGTAATDIDGYRVEWALYSTPDTWVLAGTSPTNQLQFTTATGLPILVRVLCYDRSGNRSEWTTLTAPHTTESDTTPPGVPSTPTGGDYLGTVTCRWDGKTESGADMLAAHPDFSHVELHMSTTSNFTPTEATKIGHLYGAGTYTYADLPYEVTQYFRLVAVDLRGNKSDPSGQGSGTPGKLLGDDVFAGAIGTAQLANAAVKNAQIDALAVNDAQIMNLGVGKLTAGTLQASMVIGTGKIATGTTGARAEMDSAGLRLYDANGNTTVQMLAASGSAMISGEYRTSLTTGKRLVFNPNGSQPDEIRFYPANTNQYGRMRTITSIATGYENQAGMVIKGYSARGDGQSGEVSAFPSYAALAWGNEMEGGAVTARISASQAENFLGGARTRISAPVSSGNTRWYGALSVGSDLDNYDGTPWGSNSTTVTFTAADSGSGSAQLLQFQNNSGIQFDRGNGEGIISFVKVQGGLCRIQALNYGLSSSRSLKRSIVPLREDDGFDPLAVIESTRARTYLLRNEVGRRHVGLIAEELPDLLRSAPVSPGDAGPVAEDGKGGTVDLYALISTVWEALAQLKAQVDELAAPIPIRKAV